MRINNPVIDLKKLEEKANESFHNPNPNYFEYAYGEGRWKLKQNITQKEIIELYYKL